MMSRRSATTLLDGAMGTLLAARGVRVDGPLWSARALIEAPDEVAAIHRAYAQAGASIHTANTFRADTPELIEVAVRIARAEAGAGRVAGSIGPAADCYQPEHTPPIEQAAEAHQRKARLLVEAGVHLLLLETFAHPREAVAAVEACTGLGVPVWLSLTAGPHGALASPSQLARVALDAAAFDLACVLVNCTDAELTLPYVEALRAAKLPMGAYANAGSARFGHMIEWGPAPSSAELRVRAERYAQLAERWVQAGAEVIGGCCGTGREHTEVLREVLSE